MRESLQVDAVLQAAVQEMRRALSLSEVEVRIGKAPVLAPADGDGNSAEW